MWPLALSLTRLSQRKEAEGALCVLQPSTVYINLLFVSRQMVFRFLRGAFLPSTYRTVMEWNHGLAGCIPTPSCLQPGVPHT